MGSLHSGRSWTAAAAAAAVLSMGGMAGAATVSVNFVGGQGGPGGADFVTGTAGVSAVGNWNNFTAATQAITGINDSTGALAGNIQYTSPNLWAATGSAPGGGGNASLMSGYLDNFAGGGNNIIVSGLGTDFTSTGYFVLVYINTDSAGVQGYTATDTNANTDTAFGRQAGGAGSNFPLAGPDGFIVSTDTTNSAATEAANVIRLNGFNGSGFTLTGINGAFGDGRARINGFQIVSNPIPEPGTVALLGAGLAGAVVMIRRRRMASAAAC